jgi:hypothetical protein
VKGGDHREKTLDAIAFIAYCHGIRSYRLREEARASEARARSGTGGNAAAGTGCARSGTRPGARSGACEAGEEVTTCGNDQFVSFQGPRTGAFSLEGPKGCPSVPETTVGVVS